MARIRSVHPDLCTSETMAKITARAERTFVRLWTHCDDEGRCRDDPRLICAALYPLHDDMTAADVDGDLWDLARPGVELVVRYELDGKQFLAVRSWGEFQHPQRPSKSKFPDPSASTPRAFPTAETEPSPRHVREPSASPPRALRAGVEWSGEGVEKEKERDANSEQPYDDDAIALTERAREHFARTMGKRYDRVEVDAVIHTVRLTHGTDAIEAVLAACQWPSDLQRALPSKPTPAADAPRPRIPEWSRCQVCNQLAIQGDCGCYPAPPTLTLEQANA